MRSAGALRCEGYALMALARVLIDRGGAEAREEAEATLAEAERVYAEMGARNLQAFVHVERAKLSELEGNGERHAAELASALHLFRTMRAPVRVRQVEAELARATG